MIQNYFELLVNGITEKFSNIELLPYSLNKSSNINHGYIRTEGSTVHPIVYEGTLSVLKLPLWSEKMPITSSRELLRTEIKTYNKIQRKKESDFENIVKISLSGNYMLSSSERHLSRIYHVPFMIVPKYRRTLNHVIGKSSISQTTLNMYQLSKGVRGLHKKLKSVHRDIKPTNCLLDEEGNLFLNDFSLLSHIRRGPTTFERGVGTEPYMNYWQHLGGLYFQNDIWGMAMTYLGQLTGKTEHNLDLFVSNWNIVEENFDFLETIGGRDVLIKLIKNEFGELPIQFFELSVDLLSRSLSNYWSSSPKIDEFVEIIEEQQKLL